MRKNAIKRLTLYIGLILSISALLGAIWKLDARYAKAEDVHAIQRQLSDQMEDLQIYQIETRIAMIEERIWQLELRYGTEPRKMPLPARDLRRRLVCEREDQERRLKRIVDGKVK